MGHEESLGAMVDELSSARAMLERYELLAEDLHERRSRGSGTQASALRQWWFQLSEAMEVVGRQIDIVRALAAGRERESTSRRLCAVVVRVLRNHYNRLAAEAELWMN